MRVAQRTISRNYLRTLNGALSKRAESFERGSTGLKFATLSENVSDGTRAMHVQEQRYQATQYLDNTNNLLYEMNSVDSNMESIHSILQTAQEKVLKGMSESMGQDGRDVLAKEISKLKEEILQFANAQYGGKYLFSGTNNSAAPFTVNEDTGKLMYNGIEVEKIQKEDGEYFYMDENNQKVTIPKNDPIYADIGLGYRYDGNMTADPRTAFQVSFSGLDLLGFSTTTGENGTQVSGNVYDLLTEIENSLTPDLNKEALDDQYMPMKPRTWELPRIPVRKLWAWTASPSRRNSRITMCARVQPLSWYSVCLSRSRCSSPSSLPRTPWKRWKTRSGSRTVSLIPLL